MRYYLLILLFTFSCSSRTLSNALSGAVDGAVYGPRYEHYFDGEEDKTRNLCAYTMREILKSDEIILDYILETQIQRR